LPEIISCTICIYDRFNITGLDVADLLAE
jgi:hypothetical protein